ncbi:MAG: clostripain-related cysteine peptidase [Treponemataceae bacterium]
MKKIFMCKIFVKRFFGSVLFLIFFLFFASCSHEIGGICRINDEVVGDGTLVMIYMAGANNLSSEVIRDINRMELGLFHANELTKLNLKVVVLADQFNEDSKAYWPGCRLYEITPGSSYLITSKLINTASNSKGPWRMYADQEEDMGNIKTLENFILWARETYPYYSKHALILWNHGNGIWSDYNYKSRGVCNDEESGTTKESIDNLLYVGEISELLEKYYHKNNKLEFLGFDACLMGMYEVAYQFRNCVKYMTASPAAEYGGWDFSYIFSTESSFKNGADFALNAVDGYKILRGGADRCTITAFDLSHIEELKSAIDELAYALASDYNSSTFPWDTKSLSKIDRQKNIIEKLKNEAQFFNPVRNSLYLSHFPYYDLGTIVDILMNGNQKVSNTVVFAPGTVSCASNVKNELYKVIMKTWLCTAYGNKYGKGIYYGMSIFNSSKTYYNGRHSFYSDELYTTGSIFGYGRIAAANKNLKPMEFNNAKRRFEGADVVDTWKELMEFWYSTSPSY